MPNFSVNPLTFKTEKIGTEDQQRKFVEKLGRLLSEMVNTFIAPLIVGSQLTASNTALGTVSTNQTVNVANATSVMISLSTGTALTLTLSNLQVGIPVVVRVAFTATVTLKFAATTPAGATYAITGITGAGTAVNLVTTGIGPGAISLLMPGNSVTEAGTPTLYLGIVG